MRDCFHETLKNYFRTQIIIKRDNLNLTQEQMAELLSMAERSYSDIERGVTCCSAVTLARYMIFLGDDMVAFIEGLCKAVDANENDAA